MALWTSDHVRETAAVHLTIDTPWGKLYVEPSGWTVKIAGRTLVQRVYLHDAIRVAEQQLSAEGDPRGIASGATPLLRWMPIGTPVPSQSNDYAPLSESRAVVTDLSNPSGYQAATRFGVYSIYARAEGDDVWECLFVPGAAADRVPDNLGRGKLVSCQVFAEAHHRHQLEQQEGA